MKHRVPPPPLAGRREGGGRATSYFEHAGSDGHFGGLGANRARRQAVANEHLQTVHQRLGQRAPVIAT